MTNEEFEKIEEIYRRYKELINTKEEAKEIKEIIESNDVSNFRMISFDFGWDENLEFSVSEETRNYIKKEVINMLEKVIQDCSEKIEAIKMPRN
ncbi:hypothetical protein [Clostridioides difficile]|uniref:hypothetical protein n=1 Tax=Clostridioides difficile TaxID=1496 RepID=UPI0021C631A7|nr:hypothetical protein [Clostridioides difficile]UUV14817.1 hypothetical protein NQ183_00145 [Clostridioides difficile]